MVFSGAVKKRLVAASCVFALLSYAAGAWALGFGEVRVHSTLNEPLDATIDLSSLSKAERDSLSVGVAPPEMFQRFGIERSALADELRVDMRGQPGSKRVVVHLSTRRPLREPFLRFLIEARTNSGKALREYTVLLDPPGRAPVPTASGRSSTASAPAPRRATPAARASRSAPMQRNRTASANSYGPVRSGETLNKIATQIGRPGTTTDQKQVAIFRANPQAFGGNMNLLRRGAMLAIPPVERIAAIDNREARSTILSQRRAFAPAPANDSAGDPVAVESAGAATRGNTSTGQAAAPAVADATLRLEPPSGDYANAAHNGSGRLFGRLVEPDFESNASPATTQVARARRVAAAAGVGNAAGADPATAMPVQDGSNANTAGQPNDRSAGTGAGSPATDNAAGASSDVSEDESRPLSAAEFDVVGSAGFGLLSPVTLLSILVLMALIAALLVWSRRRQYQRVALDFGADASSPDASAEQVAGPAERDEHDEPGAAGPAVASSVRVQDANRQMKIGLFDQARSTLETGLTAAPDDAALQDKLLELDYLAGDDAAFASNVARFDDTLAENGVRWAGVVAMGRVLLPDDPRFAAGDKKAVSKAEDRVAETPRQAPQSLDNDEYFGDPEPAPTPPPAGTSPYQLAESAEPSSDPSAGQDEPGVIDLPEHEQAAHERATADTVESGAASAFVLEPQPEHKPLSVAESEPGNDNEARPDPGQTMDDDSDDGTALSLDTRDYEWQPQEIASGRERQHDRSDEPGMAFELDPPAFAPDRDAPAESDEQQREESAERGHSGALDRADRNRDPESVDREGVEIEAPVKETATQQAPVEDPAVEQSGVDNAESRASELDDTDIETPPVDSGHELPPIDSSEFDLGDDSETANEDNTGDSESDSVDIRLDLARMYIDMEDPGAARELLDEAMAEGDDAQRGKAQALIDGL